MARNPRKYRHRVSVYAQTGSADSYGGTTLSGSLLSTVWADVSTISQDKTQDYGLHEVREAIRVFVRKNDTVDWRREDIYLVYKSKNWHINSVNELNLWDVEYELICNG